MSDVAVCLVYGATYCLILKALGFLEQPVGRVLQIIFVVLCLLWLLGIIFGLIPFPRIPLR